MDHNDEFEVIQSQIGEFVRNNCNAGEGSTPSGEEKDNVIPPPSGDEELPNNRDPEDSESEEEDVIPSEVKELMRNYKKARREIYEPCNKENISQCLAGLQEQLKLMGINYVFNPFTELTGDGLTTSALVSLINAVYMTLHQHKRLKEFADIQTENKCELEKKNSDLSKTVQTLLSLASSTEKQVTETMRKLMYATHSEALAREEARVLRARDTFLSSRLVSMEHFVKVQQNRPQSDHSTRRENRERFGMCSSQDSPVDWDSAPMQVMKQLVNENRRLTDQIAALKKDLLASSLHNTRLSQ